MSGRMGSYTLGARVFHWGTVVAVMSTIPLGVAMLQVEGPLQGRLYDLHRSCGALVLALTALRLAWRLMHRPPPFPPDMPAWQRGAAQLVHGMLYLLLFATPLAGWAATSAYRAPIVVFGLFQLPPILREDRALSEKLFPVHTGLAATLCAFLAVHIAAALYHHFICKDRILARMWPAASGSSE